MRLRISGESTESSGQPSELCCALCTDQQLKLRWQHLFKTYAFLIRSSLMAPSLSISFERRFFFLPIGIVVIIWLLRVLLCSDEGRGEGIK